MTSYFPNENELVKLLQDSYGINSARLTPSQGGADIESKVYKAEADGKSYFVKLKIDREENIGVSVIDFLKARGVKEIIPRLKPIKIPSKQDENAWILSVTPYIDGRDGFSSSLSKSQWHKLGAAIKQIHSLNVPTGMAAHETYGTYWRERVRSLYGLIESEPAGDDLAIAFHKFIKTHLDEIKALVNQTEVLAKEIKKTAKPFVLCHADLHAGNILIDTQGEIYIIDWEAPILAPKERDLMFIGGGVGNVWNRAEETEWFLQGYGDDVVDPRILAYYRIERILEDTAIYTQQILQSTDDAKTREQSFNHFTAQFEPNGVVEIAKRTLNDC